MSASELPTANINSKSGARTRMLRSVCLVPSVSLVTLSSQKTNLDCRRRLPDEGLLIAYRLQRPPQCDVPVDNFTQAPEHCEDRFGRRGPPERPRISVVEIDEVADFSLRVVTESKDPESLAPFHRALRRPRILLGPRPIQQVTYG